MYIKLEKAHGRISLKMPKSDNERFSVRAVFQPDYYDRRKNPFIVTSVSFWNTYILLQMRAAVNHKGKF